MGCPFGNSDFVTIGLEFELLVRTIVQRRLNICCFLFYLLKCNTECQRSLDQFYIVIFYRLWAKTSWKDSRIPTYFDPEILSKPLLPKLGKHIGILNGFSRLELSGLILSVKAMSMGTPLLLFLSLDPLRNPGNPATNKFKS